MREYGIVTPCFWVGNTGRLLRSDTSAQLLALYLTTSPHANMIGLYYCPIAYIMADTGLPFEGASKGLQRLSEVGFITLDSPSEWVWVREMARFQIAESLKPRDKRVAGIIKELDKIPNIGIKRDFIEKYRDAYHLGSLNPTSPSEGPSKPLRSQDQDQDQEQEQEKKKRVGASPSASPQTKGYRLPENFEIPAQWLAWASAKNPQIDAALEAEKFVDYWKAKPGKDGFKLDWEATWHNWIRNARQQGSVVAVPLVAAGARCIR